MEQIKNFPAGFLESLENCDGFDKERFMAAHAVNPPTSIRINPEKLAVDSITEDPVPWFEGAYYLPARPSFTLDPLFHAGAYYVQEASSMFSGYILKQVCDLKKPLRILDLCAAPGGKSTLIASLLSGESLLISNELIRNRASVLKENIIKWGNHQVVVTANEAADFSGLRNYFDIIFVDAPCSGSGLFRKDPASMKEWSRENVLMCSRRQNKILDDVRPALKTGGFLIYSTCSYSKEEDEDIIEQCIKNNNWECIKISLPDNTGIIENKFGYRFYPDKIQGEGFFISALKKINDGENESDVYPGEITKTNENEQEIISKWINNTAQFTFHKKGNAIFAADKKLFGEINRLQSKLNLIKSGVEIGEIKNNELVPSHEMALCTGIKKLSPTVEVDLPVALNYLRKNTIELDQLNTGWHLITYKNIPLGWVKILPGRVNNYYPTGWRIRNL